MTRTKVCVVCGRVFFYKKKQSLLLWTKVRCCSNACRIERSKHLRPWLDEAIRNHHPKEGLLGTLKALKADGHDMTSNVVNCRTRRLGVRRAGLPVRAPGHNAGRSRDCRGRLLPVYDDEYLPSPADIRATCEQIRGSRCRDG